MIIFISMMLFEVEVDVKVLNIFKGVFYGGSSPWSINFSQYFFFCFIVFLYMSAGCVSTLRSCVQGYLEWLPFVFASHLHFTLCD